jgi:hypothetical protein
MGNLVPDRDVQFEKTEMKPDMLTERKTPEAKFSVMMLDDRYLIQGVRIYDKQYTIDMHTKQWMNGWEHTQEEWCDIVRHSEWKIPSLPAYIGIITGLYLNRFDPSRAEESLTDKIRFDFHKQFYMTSTRIAYNNSGPDSIVHDWGTPTAHEIQESLAGETDDLRSGIGLEKIFLALCGTDDIDRLNRAIKHITGEELRVYTKKSSPHLPELAAVIGCRHEDECTIGMVEINWPAHAVIMTQE